MISEQELKRVSKKLSYVLRHQPQSIGISLDSQGWVNVEELLAGFRKQNIYISIQLLKEVVEKNDKQRFGFNEDKTKIRANQGHSVKIDLGYTPQKPPNILFHGTATKNLNSIQEKGLVKGNRHHVHLSADETTAKKVGARHGKPIILKVEAGEMFEAGFEFFQSENGVWLTDHVPTEFLVIP